MAASKAYLSFLLINLSSFFHLCLCDGGGSLEALLPSLVQSAGLDPQCMQKLLPCQPYLKAPTNPPPACCNPLNELAANSSDCICNLLNNPQLFLSFEASKEDIMKLPTACGVDVDASTCNANAGTSPTSAGTSPSSKETSPSSEVEDETAAEDDTPEDSASSTKYGITYSGAPGFVALLTALVFSAY